MLQSRQCKTPLNTMTDICRVVTIMISVAAFSYGHNSTCSKYGGIRSFEELTWNRRLRRSTYLQFHPHSLKECAIECLVRSGRCKSINYSQQMSFCELNYKNSHDDQSLEKWKGFGYIDISAWSKDMVGICEHTVCKENERCSIQTGRCSLSDCGPVDFDIPQNSILQNYGHHEVGNAVDFICEKGYRMYDKNTFKLHYDGIIKCNASGHWQDVEFICLACDPKQLYVDRFAEPEQVSVLEERHVFQCKSGYTPYNEFGPLTNSVIKICNKTDHKWRGPDFFCKNAKTALQDYCQHGYTYNKKARVCYKYHPEKLSQHQAQKVCIVEHAHLIVATKLILEVILKSFAENTPLIVDGVRNTSNEVIAGWAKQSLNYSIFNLNVSHDQCFLVTGEQLESFQCGTKHAFMCQFELCPETAGYTYDVAGDNCYLFKAPSVYRSDICTETEGQYMSTLYQPSFLPTETEHQKNIYKILESHISSNQQETKTYYLSVYPATYSSAHSVCNKKKLHLVELYTVEQKQAAVDIIRQRTNYFFIALMLSAEDTYIYKYTDGTKSLFIHRFMADCTVTDQNHCVVIESQGGSHCSDCSAKHGFICSGPDNKDIEIRSDFVNFKDAGAECNKTKKSLVNADGMIVRKEIRNLLENETSAFVSKYFIGAKLAHKKYIYKWLYSGHTMLGTHEDFTQGYSNDIKDARRKVAFNSTSMKFELESRYDRLQFLCEENKPFAWVDAEDSDGNPFAVQLAKLTETSVDKGSVLPSVCAINTNDIIMKLNLTSKKPAFK